MSTAADFLRISPRIRVLPIVHGSGDFAVRVRAELLEQPCDCLAVPLAFYPAPAVGGHRHARVS